jgi:putative ATP-dependent endonuclease of the OLD family
MAEATTPQVPGFGIANYRSFGKDGFVIEHPSKVNVFIGKNNAGKSNILRAVQFIAEQSRQAWNLAGFDPIRDGHRATNKNPIVTVFVSLKAIFRGKSNYSELINRYEPVLGARIHTKFELPLDVVINAAQLDTLPEPTLQHLCTDLGGAGRLDSPDSYRREITRICTQRGKNELHESLSKLVSLPVFRQVSNAALTDAIGGAFDGRDIVHRLRQMQSPGLGKHSLRKIFDSIQQLVRTLLGERNLDISVPATEDDILVAMHGNQPLPLANFGTGVHHLVILCAALAIHSGYVVTIEEPEVHLHPALQRHFLRFISRDTQNTYFITTHSSVFLDAVPDVTLYHVRFDGETSSIHQVAAPPAAREILSDMGYKASDLLQANGVIWVEGPSDRVYLNRWLKLVDSDLVEGIHYSIAFYGGKLLAHLSCEDNAVADLVQVLRINQNILVMMDRDGDRETKTLNASKTRIQEELGEEFCWVTSGREVENYLSRDLLNRFLQGKRPGTSVERWTKNQKLGPTLRIAAKSAGGRGLDYDGDKVGFARDFAKLMTADELNVLDLRERLAQVISRVRKWNSSDVPAPDVIAGSTSFVA